MQYQANRHTIPQIQEWLTSYQDHLPSLGIQPRVPKYSIPRFPIIRRPIPRYPIPRFSILRRPIPRYPIPGFSILRRPIQRYPVPSQFSQERCSSKESFRISPAGLKSGNSEKNLPENSFQIDHRSKNLCAYYGNKNNSVFSNPYLANESLLPSIQQFQENMVLYPFQHFQSNQMISYQPFQILGSERLAITEQYRNIQVPRDNRSIPQLMSYDGGNLSQREYRGEISDFESETSKHSAFSNQHLANGEPLSLIQQDLQENEPIHSTQEYQDNHKIYKALPETFNFQSCPPRFPNHGCSTNIQASCNKKEKPYQCNVCDKTLAQKGYHKCHRRDHTNERPYHCDICEKCFKRRDHLKVHFRIHTNERPYQCDICHKRFNNGSNLIVHIRTHTKERPYQCHICTKSFAQRKTLNIHIRTHTKKGSYQSNLESAVSR